MPYGTPPGWAPYSTGSWVWDPYYGWTWVDDAVWGWAPFHYGRWVYLDGIWAWAPGPVIVRPLFAPALVAFFSLGRGVSVGIGIVEPAVGWVALGWGEPLHPWWGGPGFVGVPWWGGWGGPRIGHTGERSSTTTQGCRMPSLRSMRGGSEEDRRAGHDSPSRNGTRCGHCTERLR